MIIVEIEINSTVRRLCDQMGGYDDAGTFYYPYIMEFPAVQYKMDEPYGGFVKMSFGSLALSPDLFSAEADWPPPLEAEITAKYTASTPSAAVTLFTGTGFRNRISAEGIEYRIYDQKFDTPILTETTDYYGEDVPIPRAFGEVIHEQPLRLPDIDVSGTDYPNYHKSYMSGNLAKKVSSAADNGAGNARITTAAAHGFTDGEVAIIEGTTNYNGAHIITFVSSTQFDIAAAYISSQTGAVYADGDWRVYLDGVSIPEHVVDVGDGTFRLDTYYSGEITLSGAAPGSTLLDAMTWAASQLSLTLVSTYARPTSPEVGFWVDDQDSILTALSEYVAACTHLYYVSGSNLHLVDMDRDNGSEEITEYEFFPSVYTMETPVRRTLCRWTERVSSEASYGDYVAEIDRATVQLSDYPYGESLEITPPILNNTRLRVALRNVLEIAHRPRADLKMPIAGALPEPGKKITWSDSRLIHETENYIRARDIRYDFARNAVTVSGEGYFGEEPVYAVPKGIIVAINSDTVPDNWLRYDGVTPYGRYIVGAGDTYDPGDTGGSSTVNASSSTSGSHSGTSYSYFKKSSGSDVSYGVISAAGSSGDHSHTVSFTLEPAHETLLLIQADSGQENFPADTVVFGKTNTAPTGLSSYSTSGGLFRAGSDSSSAADSTSNVTMSSAGGHTHANQGQTTVYGSSMNPALYDPAPAHSDHTLSPTITKSIKRAFVRAWTKTAAFAPDAGMIAMYDDTTPPDGWALCDGTDSTPDLRDYFLEISSDGTTASTGTNQVTVSGTLSTLSHNHNGGVSSGTTYAYQAAAHLTDETHSHTVSGSVSFVPSYYALVFIIKTS